MRKTHIFGTLRTLLLSVAVLFPVVYVAVGAIRDPTDVLKRTGDPYHGLNIGFNVVILIFIDRLPADADRLGKPFFGKRRLLI